MQHLHPGWAALGTKDLPFALFIRFGKSNAGKLLCAGQVAALLLRIALQGGAENPVIFFPLLIRHRERLLSMGKSNSSQFL